MTIPRRNPATLMRLKRLGSFHQCRLSFMRILTRRMAAEQWQFERPIFAINNKAIGHAVYTARGPERSYSLVAFAHELPANLRSDRVIAEAWDCTFALFDGVPTADDIKRLAANVPRQEAGRVSENELTLSRANRSVRLWEHVVNALAAGRQPDIEQIERVGYLMRTTAVYGSGKFGAKDREMLAERNEFQAPFQTEMLTVYLIRTFVRDLVQHCADIAGGDNTVTLCPTIARRLGIGNSTGLGMAPFLVNHPVLFNNWIMVREEAISRVRSLANASATDAALFKSLFERTAWQIGTWHSEHPVQIQKLVELKNDITAVQTFLLNEPLMENQPWNRLMSWAEASLSEEGQELLASLILEPYPDLVDGLQNCMADNYSHDFQLDGSMPVSAVRTLLEQKFEWALPLDWTAPENCARAWYVSEEKEEPRLGERFDEPIADYEQALAPARDAASAYHCLNTFNDDQLIAEFLLKHPEHRKSIYRAQLTAHAPYAEIRDNTISSTLMPIDMLRAKLSFFGAINFDPRSDRWVRICMYTGAPYPEDLNADNADLWIYPELDSEHS